MAYKLLLSVAAVALVSASDVLELDDTTFDAALASHTSLLVAFVAPWCGHCQKLKPEYAKAATALKGDGIHLAQVDANAHKELAERYGVTGFPTIKFFRSGEASEYNGGRDEASIVSWMKKRAGPPATRVNGPDEASTAVKGHDVAVIAFSAEGSDSEAAVFKVAAALEDVAVLVTDAAAVRERFGASASASAILISNFDGEEARAYYEDAVTDEAAFKAWINAHSLPEVVTFSQEAAPRIFRGEQKKHFLLFADKKSSVQSDVYKGFVGAAKENRGKALFVLVPPSEDKVMSYFGVTPADMPTAVLVHMSQDNGMKKFKYSGAFTAEAMGSFLDDVASGAIKPFLKSDPVPSDAEMAQPGVKTVVGASFASVVLDASKDVLLEVYAPWCGHCKQLEPVYKKLAEKLADKSNIVIAKMDGTSNEIDYPGVNIRGFPSIYFFKAGAQKAALEYDGGRDLEGFITYLSKQSSVKFSVDDFDLDDDMDE